MQEFFQGWKRKVGVVLLIATGLFFSGWIRSISYADHLTYRVWLGRRGFEAVSFSSAYRVFVFEIVEQSHLPKFSEIKKENFDWHSEPWAPTEPHFRAFLGPDEFFKQYSFGHKYFQGLGVVFARRQKGIPIGQTGSGVCESYFVVAPYLIVITPLTLLSAWLLLSKPRATRPSQHRSRDCVELL